jgi:hypothetical protein
VQPGWSGEAIDLLPFGSPKAEARFGARSCLADLAAFNAIPASSSVKLVLGVLIRKTKRCGTSGGVGRRLRSVCREWRKLDAVELHPSWGDSCRPRPSCFPSRSPSQLGAADKEMDRQPATVLCVAESGIPVAETWATLNAGAGARSTPQRRSDTVLIIAGQRTLSGRERTKITWLGQRRQSDSGWVLHRFVPRSWAASDSESGGVWNAKPCGLTRLTRGGSITQDGQWHGYADASLGPHHADDSRVCCHPTGW